MAQDLSQLMKKIRIKFQLYALQLIRLEEVMGSLKLLRDNPQRNF
jgi:hypothetical protein